MSTTFFKRHKEMPNEGRWLDSYFLKGPSGYAADCSEGGRLSSPSEIPFHGLGWDNTLGFSSWIQDKAVNPWS